ncbi:hypothetical protein HCZ84_08890 [Limosilactobacillus fermentum]
MKWFSIGNLLNKLRLPISTASNIESEKARTDIVPVVNSLDVNSYTFEIRPDIINLLYFTSGPLKNLSFEVNEPSAIDTTLPLSKAAPDKTDYYPRYSSLTSSQRFSYLKWLERLNAPVDLGYPFLTLYNMERRIATNSKVEEAVSIIKELRSNVDNPSFNYYSAVALTFASMRYQEPKYILDIDFNKVPIDLAILLSFQKTHKLSSNFLIQNYRKFGWKNKNYLKNYPDRFKSTFEDLLIKRFGHPYFPEPKTAKFDSFKNLTLSNYSLPDDIRIIKFPDFISDSSIAAQIFKIFSQTHSEIKNYLQKHPESRIKRPNKKTLTINVSTGYPMASESSIKRTRDELKMRENLTPSQRKSDLLLAATEFGENGVKNSILNYGYDVIGTVGIQGELDYKTGEWDKAEKELISCLQINPNYVTRLAIMYRKQRRYKDEINVLNYVIANWPLSPFNAYGGNTTDFVVRLTKAKEYLKKHKESDCSRGVNYVFLDYDADFLQQLLGIGSKNY